MVGLCESNKISRTAQEIRSIIIISIFKQTYFTMSASSTSIANFSNLKRTCHAKKVPAIEVVNEEEKQWEQGGRE